MTYIRLIWCECHSPRASPKWFHYHDRPCHIRVCWRCAGLASSVCDREGCGLEDGEEGGR
jgi:hypothetical protein